MARYLIKGGKPLSGELRLSGAKNSVLPILAASLLPCSKSRLDNVPELTDVRNSCNILECLGCSVERGKGHLTVDPESFECFEIPDRLMREMRSSILFLGAVLAKCGEAKLTRPGGCALGARPIDTHLDAMTRMGAVIKERAGWLECSAPQGLHGADIRFSFPSVGATENVLIAAATARGTTLIHNAAREPEVLDLADYLRACGAEIVFPAEGVLKISGVPTLYGCEHRVIPDRIAGATYLAGAAATGGRLLLKNSRPEHMGAILPLLKAAGANIEIGENDVLLEQRSVLKALGTVRTEPYPGFPTDAQAQMMALATRAEGISVFIETIFENRFHHAEELVKMGADISTDGNVAIVRGVKDLKGAQVEARDLRGGAALVLAALSAGGETVLSGIKHIERGYEDFVENLRFLGADIEMIE